MAEFSGTHFLFKKKPTRRPALRVDTDGWYSCIPPETPEPPQPPAPPAPTSPPASPAPPVPPSTKCPVSPQHNGNQPVLTLLLPLAFDEYLSELDSNKAPNEYVDVEYAPASRWGQPDDCPWDESAIGADDDVADTEEASRANGAEGGTRATAEGGTAEDVFPEGVPSDDDDDNVESVGYQKQRMTMMLACTADGVKLKPWVFFKRKALPKGDFPSDVVVACHENGWMDSEGIIRWLEECVKPFLKPRFGRQAKSSMVVLDSYHGHLIEGVKETLREMNSVPAIIPSGCTAEVQPLDVSIKPDLTLARGWEMLDLTNNKMVTSVEVIFYETLLLEVWKAKFGPASGRTQEHPPTDTSTATVPLLAEVDEPADDDVVEVLPPPPVLAPPFPVADWPASTPVSATGDEGSLEALPVAPASGIAGSQQGAKLVDQDGKPSTTGEQQTGEPVEQEATAGLVDDLAIEEGELSVGEESTDSDVVEVPIMKPEMRRTGRARRLPERLSFHACLPPAAFTTMYDEVNDLLYDDAEEDEELPELDPDVHADPEHRWDIATMMVKEAMESWKGEAVKAAMEEEIRSLIRMGTRELVERPRGVNIMKNRWVLTTKYRINDTVEREKARLVVKGFTQVCDAEYDETYSPVSSYVMLRIFLSIVAILDLNLMQLDMKNAFLQSKLDRVLYMYQPDYFDNGTGRVCKLLKSLYRLKQTPVLWYRALDGVLLGAGWKKSQVDEALYFKTGDNGVTCWVVVYVNDLHQLCDAEGAKGAAGGCLRVARDFAGRQGYADKLRKHFIDEEQGSRVPKTPVLVDAYVELTFDDEEAHEREEEEEYRQKVGSLQFAATTTRPDIAFAYSKLGSGLTVRSDQHWCEVDRCLAYLADTHDTALEFSGGSESLELIGYVDANDACDKQNRTSTGGYVFAYGGAAVSCIGGDGAGDTGAGGTGAGGAGAGGAGARSPGAGGTGAGGVGVGGTGAGDPKAGGAGAGGAGASGPGAGGTVQRRPFFVPPLLSPPPHQSQPQLQPDSLLPAPSPYAEQTDSFTEHREPESRPASPVRAVCTSRLVPRPPPPPVPDTHIMALRPSSVPLRVPLPPPPASSLPAVPNPESDIARAASPIIPRLLATVVTDPSFESTAASALVAELVDFAAACHLDYATSLTTVPHLVAMLLALEGDPDAPDIPTPHSYAEAITGPYSSQWQTAMDAEMASWKSTCTYVDAVPPSGANIVDGMWIFRVKLPPGSPPVFKNLYVARGFSQQQGNFFFQTFSPTPKMTTLQVLLLLEEIWLRPPFGFTGSFPAGTQWSLRRPVYGLRQAPYEWHDTLRTTLAPLGFSPLTADPSLFLRTDTSLPPFYVLVYVDDLVFATADIEALALVKSELQKRHTCTDLGELRSYLGLQITQDRARRTITLTQSHMVHQVLQRFRFRYSSPQSTPLPTGHSLTAPPLDESVELSGPYPELVGCLMYLMTCTRPDLAYPLSILARYVAPRRHRPEHWEAAKRVLRYLCSTSGMGLVLGGRGPVVLTGHADPSWVDDFATQQLSHSYTFGLGSGSVSWQSTRSSSVLSSSCKAEIYTGAMAAQELHWLTYLLTDL
ncbi:unnamed protein product [Closterium sp. NIES-53]